METEHAQTNGYQRILQHKFAELTAQLRNREGIAIEKSADQMDEIQYASERDLAIQNVHAGTSRLREVTAALQRLSDGSFGTCIDCDMPISPKRLQAVPWAPRCISCQEIADQAGQQDADPSGGLLIDAA